MEHDNTNSPPINEQPTRPTMDNAYAQQEHDAPVASWLPPQHSMKSTAANRSSSSLPSLGDVRRNSFIRVPCRARGVTGDNHNPRNAFIQIPFDAVHGTVLICSHPLCAGSGRRFRYCIQCKMPVAKRNFRDRHSHEGIALGAPPTSPMDDYGLEQQKGRMLQDQNGAKTLGIEETGDLHLGTTNAPQVSISQLPLFPLCSEAMEAPQERLSKQEALELGLTEKEYSWLSLLHGRPPSDDTEGMSAWMGAVLEASNNNRESSMVASSVKDYDDGLEPHPFRASTAAARPLQEEYDEDDLSDQKPAAVVSGVGKRPAQFEMHQHKKFSRMLNGDRMNNLKFPNSSTEQNESIAIEPRPADPPLSRPRELAHQHRYQEMEPSPDLSVGEASHDDGVEDPFSDGFSFDSEGRNASSTD